MHCIFEKWCLRCLRLSAHCRTHIYTRFLYTQNQPHGHTESSLLFSDCSMAFFFPRQHVSISFVCAFWYIPFRCCCCCECKRVPWASPYNCIYVCDLLLFLCCCCCCFFLLYEAPNNHCVFVNHQNKRDYGRFFFYYYFRCCVWLFCSYVTLHHIYLWYEWDHLYANARSRYLCYSQRAHISNEIQHLHPKSTLTQTNTHKHTLLMEHSMKRCGTVHVQCHRVNIAQIICTAHITNNNNNNNNVIKT